jgi:hypothetical protein
VPFELGEESPQALTTSRESLGQPFPHLGPRQFMSNQSGPGQAPAEILPDECVQGTRGGIPGRAAFALGQP